MSETLPNFLTFHIYANNNPFDEACLKIQSCNSINFNYKQNITGFKIHEGDICEGSISIQDEQIKLPKLEAQSSFYFSLEFDSKEDLNLGKFILDLDTTFCTVKYRFVEILNTPLNLPFEFDDVPCYSSSAILTKFSITAVENNPIRLYDCDLSSDRNIRCVFPKSGEVS
jgi:hypothetical protein